MIVWGENKHRSPIMQNLGGSQLTNFLTDNSVLIILEDLMNFRLTGYANCIHGAKQFRMCGMEVCKLYEK